MQIFGKHQRDYVFNEDILGCSLEEYFAPLEKALSPSCEVQINLSSDMPKKRPIMEFYFYIKDDANKTEISDATGKFSFRFKDDEPAFIYLSDLGVRERNKGLGRDILLGFHSLLEASQGQSYQTNSLVLHAGYTCGAYFWGRAGFKPIKNRDGKTLHTEHFGELVSFRATYYKQRHKSLTQEDHHILDVLHEKAQTLIRNADPVVFEELMMNNDHLSVGPAMKCLLTYSWEQEVKAWFDYANGKKLPLTAWGYPARYDVLNLAQRNRVLKYVNERPETPQPSKEMTRQRASNRYNLIL